MNNGIAMVPQSVAFDSFLETDLLGKDLDRATSKSLVADTTHPVFCDRHMAITTPVAGRQSVTKSQTCLFAESQNVPHPCYYPAFVHRGIG